jgi:hypothetical protein
MLGHPQFDTGVPVGAIEHEHNLLGGSGSCLTRKLGEFHLKGGNADGRGQMEERASRSGMDTADAGAPGKAVLHRGNASLANRRPDAAQQWLEADPMFVGCPQVHLRVRERHRHCLQQRSYLFLKVSCCSEAASAWRGRGTCRLCLSRCK